MSVGDRGPTRDVYLLGVPYTGSVYLIRDMQEYLACLGSSYEMCQDRVPPRDVSGWLEIPLGGSSLTGPSHCTLSYYGDLIVTHLGVTPVGDLSGSRLMLWTYVLILHRRHRSELKEPTWPLRLELMDRVNGPSGKRSLDLPI